MGTWDVGPFDNDTAADWCVDLGDARPQRRPEMIREALKAVVEEPDYIGSEDAFVAIAAAAIVASQRTDGVTIDSPYAPDFLTQGGVLELPEDLAALAAQALERVTGDESEWRDLWDDAGDLDNALAEIEPIKYALAA